MRFTIHVLSNGASSSGKSILERCPAFVKKLCWLEKIGVRTVGKESSNPSCMEKLSICKRNSRRREIQADNCQDDEVQAVETVNQKV